jgi:hypothetical protein
MMAESRDGAANAKASPTVTCKRGAAGVSEAAGESFDALWQAARKKSARARVKKKWVKRISLGCHLPEGGIIAEKGPAEKQKKRWTGVAGGKTHSMSILGFSDHPRLKGGYLRSVFADIPETSVTAPMHTLLQLSQRIRNVM